MKKIHFYTYLSVLLLLISIPKFVAACVPPPPRPGDIDISQFMVLGDFCQSIPTMQGLIVLLVLAGMILSPVLTLFIIKKRPYSLKMKTVILIVNILVVCALLYFLPQIENETMGKIVHFLEVYL